MSSEESPSKIEIEVDIKYILNETVAPQGYQKITGVQFTVDSEGNITVTDTGEYEDGTNPDEFDVSSYGANLYITDKEKPEEPGQPEEPTPTNTKVIIRKYAKGYYKKLLEGAELELYKISDDEKESEKESGSKKTKDKNRKNKNAKTGDTFNIIYYLGISTLALCILLVVSSKNKKNSSKR